MRTERPIESALEEASGDDAEVVLRVERRLRFQLHPRPGERATHARVLDADGVELTLDFTLPDLEAHRPVLPLTGPGTPAVAHAPGSATTLVLERDGRELRRVPLVLVPGQVNRIEP